MAFLKGKPGYVLLGAVVVLQCMLIAGFTARGVSAAKEVAARSRDFLMMGLLT